VNDDEMRRLARGARQVQNLQLALLAGMVVGAIVGLLLGVYVLMPALGQGTGFWALFVAVPVGGFIGQRIALSMVTG
jgi:uncharacterized protein YcfJ